MSTQQPEALRLADALLMGNAMLPEIDLPEAAAELRRLHALNAELLEALQYAIKQVPELATVPGIAAAIAKAEGREA